MKQTVTIIIDHNFLELLKQTQKNLKAINKILRKNDWLKLDKVVQE